MASSTFQDRHQRIEDRTQGCAGRQTAADRLRTLPFMRCRLSFATAGLLLALAAEPVCAGGLTAANYGEFGGAIVAMRTSTPLPDVIPMQTSTDRTLRPGAASGYARPASSEVGSFSIACRDGGFVKGSSARLHEEGSRSGKISLRNTFERCRAQNETLSGSERIVAATRSDGAVDTARIGTRFASLGSDRLRWVGWTTAVWTSDTANGTDTGLVTYRNLSVWRMGRNYRWSGSVATTHTPLGIGTVTFSGMVMSGHCALRLKQLDPFVFDADGKAQTGTLEVTDEEGNSLVVLAGPQGFVYRFLVSGAGDGLDMVSTAAAIR